MTRYNWSWDDYRRLFPGAYVPPSAGEPMLEPEDEPEAPEAAEEPVGPAPAVRTYSPPEFAG